MKFIVGQSFIVSDTGLKGKIIDTSFNSFYQESEYVVLWASGVTATYSTDEGDRLWVLDINCPLVASVNAGLSNKAIDKVECNGHHTWVDIGFRHTKIVCKICNLEQI